MSDSGSSLSTWMAVEILMLFNKKSPACKNRYAQGWMDWYVSRNWSSTLGVLFWSMHNFAYRCALLSWEPQIASWNVKCPHQADLIYEVALSASIMMCNGSVGWEPLDSFKKWIASGALNFFLYSHNLRILRILHFSCVKGRTDAKILMETKIKQALTPEPFWS